MRGTRGATRSCGQRLLYPPPGLDLRFAETKSLTDAISGQNLITFTRASSATVVNAAGALETVASNVPRFDHNPLTGESLGLLVEEARTNLLLNSATLSTQSVTVTAVAHTLSFYGTGTITLSGASTAGPVTGTGVFPARTTLTFTPTAGSLTLTVTGSVVNAQLEAGAFATSYIPTTTAAATRSVDVASITGTNFSSWYRQDEGTVFAEAINRVTYLDRNVFPYLAQVDDGTNNNRVSLDFSVLASGYRYSLTVLSGGSIQFAIGPFGITQNSARWAAGFRSSDFASAISVLPGTVFTSTSGTLPGAMTQLQIGAGFGQQFTGTIRRLTYWPQRLPNNSLVAITR